MSLLARSKQFSFRFYCVASSVVVIKVVVDNGLLIWMQSGVDMSVLPLGVNET